MSVWAYSAAGLAVVILAAIVIEIALRKPGKRPLSNMRPTDFDQEETAELGLEATDLEVVNRAAKINNMMGLTYGSGWPGLRKSKGRNAE